MNKAELFEKLNKDLKYYEVTEAEDVLLEDGTSRGPGYALVNTITDVVEFSTPLLAGAIWQAQHFENTLESILNPMPTPPETIEGGDILPFGPS